MKNLVFLLAFLLSVSIAYADLCSFNIDKSEISMHETVNPSAEYIACPNCLIKEYSWELTMPNSTAISYKGVNPIINYFNEPGTYILGLTIYDSSNSPNICASKTIMVKNDSVYNEVKDEIVNFKDSKSIFYVIGTLFALSIMIVIILISIICIKGR